MKLIVHAEMLLHFSYRRVCTADEVLPGVAVYRDE